MLAKIMYKPFGILIGLIAARTARKAFASTWERSHGHKAPHPTTEDATWGQVLGSAAMKASVFAVTAAAADRLGATAFRHVTGFWPGDKEPDPLPQLEARES